MPSELDFSGKNALIVGGASGIGNATARAFMTRGAEVHVTGTRGSAADYDTERGSDLTGLTYHQLDLSNRDALDGLDFSPERLDILVLSQGQVLYKRREFEMTGFAHVIEVNLMSLMSCAMRYHDALKVAGGSLIIVSSTAAYHATKGNPAYNASKTGAMGLTRTLGQAWAAEGIRVNGIAPGFVATKMTAVTTDHPDRKHDAEQRIPLGRLGTPDECAAIALFLASPLASYVIGQTLIVDGGLVL